VILPLSQRLCMSLPLLSFISLSIFLALEHFLAVHLAVNCDIASSQDGDRKDTTLPGAGGSHL
jgi:hypothetical protein